MKIQLALKHLHTVGKHRREVRRLCFKCGLYWQGLVHDLSKYSLVEFIPQIKYWTGKRSPIDEEIDDIGYSSAWLHHKGRNKHHYEYWLDPAHCKEFPKAVPSPPHPATVQFLLALASVSVVHPATLHLP